MRHFLFILIIISFDSACSKNNSKNLIDDTKLVGKWQLLSSTVYEIRNDSTFFFNRIGAFSIGDSIVFEANGEGNSYASSFNFWHGEFPYSFIPSKNILAMTNIYFSRTYIDTVAALTPNMLAIIGTGYDTIYSSYNNPIKVYPLQIVDTLYR